MIVEDDARGEGRDDATDDDDAPDDPSPLEIPIDGTLDLHTFRPADVKDLLADYVAACRARGVLEIRIIHGKGTGALRETVHAALARMPEVESFRHADDHGGNWGATVARLAAPINRSS